VSELEPQTFREYALLADGERGVLLGPSGDYAWMCFPAGATLRCSQACSAGRGTTPSTH